MNRKALLVALLVVPLASVSCSLLTDLSGYDDKIVLVGPDGGDGGGASESGSDGGVGAESGSDGGAVGEVGCKRFPDATFCEDFDGDSNPLSDQVWTVPPTPTNEGDFSINDPLPFSQPKSLRINVTNPKSGCTFINFQKVILGTYKRAKVRANVRTTSPSTLLGLSFPDVAEPGIFFDLIVWIEPGGRELAVQLQRFEGTVELINFMKVPLPEGTFQGWHDLEIEAHTEPTKEIVVHFDKEEGKLSLAENFVFKDPTSSVGLWCEDLAGASASYDDVAMWAD